MNRIEEMYEKGKQTVKSRKDRPKIEIEIEQQLHECTFHPQLQTFQNKKEEKVKFKNDIYNEKQYISLYERLKKGRLNQLVKESNNDRYELNDQLKKYIKDSKKYNLLNSQNYYSKTLPHYYNNNTMYIDDNPSTQENMNENCNLYVDINNSDKKKYNIIKHNNEPFINNDNNINNNSETNNSEKKNPENKEPLFIIDVNIEEGLTKKIYIFEGDTPKILAQKFCKENKLDIETQNKLENINCIGLMCVAPNTNNPEDNVKYFNKLKDLANSLNLKVLSMGMTNDYLVATKCGSTYIRVGTGIFGERDYTKKD